MPPVVFLDQRDWVDLAKERKGTLEPHKSDLEDVLEFVISTADTGDVVYPIDLTRFRETAYHSRPEHRDSFFDFLFDVSNGYTIAPYDIVRKEEITWRLDRVRGNAGYMTGRVVNQGLPHLFGGQNYQIVPTDGEKDPSDIPDRILQEIYDSIESRDVFDLAKDPDHGLIDMLADQEGWEAMAQELNETRHAHEEKYNDNENRRRREKIRSFMSDTIPEYFIRGFESGLSIQELGVFLGDYWSGAPDVDDAETFLQSFPAEYSFTELVYQRDIQGSDWESNDIADIESLSVAIPYCDVVTADNQFADLAHRSNLDEIYHADIITDLHELPGVVSERL
ncbi:hypothetical protein HLRTI_001334 [Halorhabdus tiamatea SARL4B]|uniref:PIN domain-containing protein n=1 Tax=Halorhabdus tiamatea SARL4B TaxID=1033806 RepID=U2E2W9_9EURY|nr:hypothetical protein [Halorhabdus tiamatea]ERJ06628.1 hypothetical protein HLRTI_001334 [Halorhabdus tiamatea SARL4B]